MIARARRACPPGGGAAALLLSLLAASSACSRGPGEADAARAAYGEYRAAVLAADATRVASFVSAARRPELAGGAGAAALQLVGAFMPSDVRVEKTSVTGGEAVLEVAGSKDGVAMTGTVRLVKEAGAWKVDKEDWTLSMGGAGGTVASLAPAAFLDDPARPPQPAAVLEGHQGEVSGLAFTPDARFLVSASYGDYSIRTWDAATGAPVSSARVEGRVRDVVVAPDGRAILSAHVGGDVRTWPLEDGRIGSPRVLVSNAGDALAVSGDGALLATAGFGSPLRLWNARDGTLREELGGAPNQRGLAVSKDGRTIVTAGDGNTYSLWTRKPRFWGLGEEAWSESREEIAKVNADAGASAVDLSRDGARLATGHNDSSIVILEVPAGRERANLYVPDAATRDVAWSPDGALLATAQQNQRVYLWDGSTGRQIAVLEGHRQAVTSVAFSPDGRTLASGGEDRRIVLWRSDAAGALASGAPAPGAMDAASPPAAADPCQSGAPPARVEVAGRANLVGNPSGDQGAAGWMRQGEATCETADGNPHFAVRYGGFFRQDAFVPSAGWVLVVARAASERVEADGDQTGLPYLYGYFVNARDPHRFNGYLSGQQMTLRGTEPNQWGVVWGVFEIPPETAAVRLMLQQADGRQPQNGSAARFDDAGVFAFETESEARAFAEAYGSSRPEP